MALTVSDHATLRFIERYYGFDVEGERRRIVELVQPFYVGRGSQGLTTQGFQFFIKDSVVVTCYPASNGRILKLDAKPLTAVGK